ncbi:alpha/beta hydrolase-fold protein [Flavobacterium sp.]|uniref:alpha/beta hydrolase n=1 Tax=Flavobacterium sp. TaxID=239 RepID=UPI002611BB63|nr:alpha/beta hydrolase-fold protein [Flavobacterium sp.]MDG2432404.1 alpha/beta hydrolase-fold protein [Flavobacterium sp.]
MKRLYFIFLFFLLIQTGSAYAAVVDTLQISSAAMNKTYKAAVVLPSSYAKSKSKYPVLYLLHGAYGHFNDWLSKTPNKDLIHQLADQYNMIVVMPEGETFSFYLDSPVNQGSQFETYITKEVVQKIDNTYRTITDRKGRVISGLSMGGHGALYLSAKHPELFCAAGSMSGAVDMGSMMTPESKERITKLMEPVFGKEGKSQEVYASYAVLNMVPTMTNNKLALILDIGVDDFLIESNRELHRRLVYSKVAHDYTERPGAHTWEYWENALPYHMLFFIKVIKSNGVLLQ